MTPRFAGPTTFYRLPGPTPVAELDAPVIGVPFDTGASFRVGARFGPRAIREASSLLRPYNRILGIDPYKTMRIDDAGDLTVSPYDPMAALTTIADHYRPIFAAGQTPLTFGGDHSITLPILRAAAAAHGPVAMIQFDSHLDTWGAYFNMEYTHGSFAIRAIEEGLIDPQASTQVAIRGMLFGPEDIERSEDWGFRTILAEEMATMAPAEAAAIALERAGDRPVYISFDIDGVDPAFAPGTGTPEVGGPSSLQATMFLQALRGARLVGADVVEVAPAYDLAGNTSLLAARLGLEILGLMALNR
ncbi:MAG: agmatinase [Thermomicrobiales bacterium]|nr:agmatinase [Thermomicrobiales bacterium]